MSAAALRAEPAKVSASEWHLLELAKFVVAAEPGIDPAPLTRAFSPVKALSPQCHEILQDILAKGCIWKLCKMGGYLDGEFMAGKCAEEGSSNSGILRGRVWERHPQFSLQFSDTSLRLLVWMHENSLESATDTKRRKFRGKAKTLGDHLLCVLAMEKAQCFGMESVLAQQASFRQSPLVWLSFPFAMCMETKGAKAVIALDDMPPENPEAAVIWECLQGFWTKRWAEDEWAKSRLRTLELCAEFGEKQEAILQSCIATIHESGRLDLCAFLIHAAERILAQNPTAKTWTANLAPPKTMAEQSRALHATGAFWRSFSTLAGWADGARALRFFDDDYEAGQLYLKLWDEFAQACYPKVQEILRELGGFDLLQDEPTGQ